MVPVGKLFFFITLASGYVFTRWCSRIIYSKLQIIFAFLSTTHESSGNTSTRKVNPDMIRNASVGGRGLC